MSKVTKGGKHRHSWEPGGRGWRGEWQGLGRVLPFICLAVPGHLVLPEALLFPEEETEPLKGQSARGLVMDMGLDQSC